MLKETTAIRQELFKGVTMGEKDLAVPMIDTDLATGVDYHKAPLSLLSILGDKPDLSPSARPLTAEANFDNVLLSNQRAIALPTRDLKAPAAWANDSLKNIYENGLFKLISNSAGDSHLGFKFLQTAGENDLPRTAFGPIRKDKLEDRLGISIHLQMKF